MRILFKITSRSRPEKFLTTLKSIVDNLSEKCDPLLLISIDDDDKEKDRYIELFQKLDEEKELPEAIIRVGPSDNKIFAINRDIAHTRDMQWDILVNVSDDQIFTKKDFDKDIVQSFASVTGEAYTQYDWDRFIHFPDWYVNDKLPTMAIMGRPYYNRFGYVYHPDYISLWCDNEQMDVAKSMGKYFYVDNHIFRHEHPANVRGLPQDELLKYNQSFYHYDGETYRKRKAAGFPKECIVNL